MHLDASKPIDLFSGAFALVFEVMIEQVNLMEVHMNDSMMFLMLAAGLSGGSGRDAVGQD